MQEHKGTGNLLGVVLCGGESRRMGRDKGLMPVENTTWAQSVAAKLSALGIPVVISVNPEQQEAYGKLFPAEQLVVDSLPVDGPILGILSAHEKYPGKDILPLACDMIDMDDATLRELLEAYQKDTTSEFIAFHHDGFLQTLGAVYTSRGLAPLLQQAKDGSLKHFSLIRVLDHGTTHRIPVPSRAAFHNYNSRNELTFPEDDKGQEGKS
ncbi:molybdenum cofactor guanylyltransferase [Paraflavisolibacter sp. H34]|uniref:molybdenum cofactor guanylyltransferase n=1 Tax=Huijunlia imazamoxiresistens TaxID=3127457 RepID=UPI00301B646A